MLAVYFSISAMNGMVWCTFSSISNKAIEYYDTSLDFINWFEMCFFISYFPLAPFVFYIIGILAVRQIPSLDHAVLYNHDFPWMLD